MRDLEPNIFRQRLIIEGHYSVDKLDGEDIRRYLLDLSKLVDMTIFSGPYSWPPDKWDNPDVKLHELNGFAAWTDSGVHIYAWRWCKFFSIDIYTCKEFDVKAAVKFSKDFFKANEMVYKTV